MYVANKEIMDILIYESKKSVQESNYPLSACIVKNNQILSLQHTSIHSLKDPTAHAEILAIREACKQLNTPILKDCWLYTTLEPCPMCVSACIWAKIDGIVFGSIQEDAIIKYHQTGKWRQIEIKARDIVKFGTPKIQLIEGFMQKECNELFDLI